MPRDLSGKRLLISTNILKILVVEAAAVELRILALGESIRVRVADAKIDDLVVIEVDGVVVVPLGVAFEEWPPPERVDNEWIDVRVRQLAEAIQLSFEDVPTSLHEVESGQLHDSDDD